MFDASCYVDTDNPLGGVLKIMEFRGWNVDLKTLSAFHTSGLRVSVEGNPLQPRSVTPLNFPEHMDAVEQANLLKTGVRAISAAAQKHHCDVHST